MKKEKLFKIGVVNKSTIDVVKDTTTFYTSDTELWLGFELVEVEHSFDSAEILLLNEDDRSFVVRPITQDQDGYWYEIEADITAHYGLWKGQLQLSKDGEVYTSKPFNFRIENDLSNDRPPQLVDVNNWTRLKQSANEIIVDMRQAITEADKSESLRVEAEQERATAESNRKSAELLRVENENQRKIDHANRSAELAGKANKKQEDWIKPTLLNGWVATDSLAYPVGFYKDEFGIVRLKGRVQGGVGSIFTLPVGYRSKNVVSGFLAQATSSDTPAKVNTTTSGKVSCQNGVTGIYLDGIAFRAEV